MKLFKFYILNDGESGEIQADDEISAKSKLVWLYDSPIESIVVVPV